MPQPDRKPSLAGGIAMVVMGLVILVPSGLCTGVFAFGPIIAAMLHPERYAYNSSSPDLVLAFIIGGPFIAAGGTLLYVGVRRLKARKAPAIDVKQLD